MDDVPLVRVGQSLGRLADDRDLGRERKLLATEVARERLAIDVGRDKDLYFIAMK